MPADIFLSYASTDRERVRPLVAALQARGWTVWWDHELVAGADFQRHIHAELAAARCVVVAWTKDSIESQWVRAEAEEGRQRKILVPAALDRVRPLVPFNLLNHADLSAWTGDAADPEFGRLVRAIGAALAGATPPVPQAATPAHRPGRLPWPWLGAAALAASLAAAGFLAWQSRTPAVTAVSAAPNTIAVLPFDNLGAPADEYRSQGFSLELVNQLARVREIAVLSPGTRLAGPTTGLQARYVVEGSVRPAGSATSIDIRLSEAGTARVLWTFHQAVDGDALAALPRDAARAIVGKMDLTLSDESRAQLDRPATTNAAALDAYLRGNALLRARPGDEALAEAESLFRRAIELDGRYAIAYAGLCRAQVARYARSEDPADYGAAEQSCRQTLALDALRSDPHMALGGLYLESGRLDQARDEFERARRLAARDADPLLGLAEVAEEKGDFAQAEKLYRDAIAREPAYWATHAGLGRFLYGRGRYEEASTAYRRAVELDAGQPRAWEDLGSARFMSGAIEDALAAWRKALELDPGPTAYSNVGTALFLRREFAEAADMYARAAELAPRTARWRGNLADALRLAGRAEAAQEAYAAAAEMARASLAVNPGDTAVRARLAGYDAALGRQELARLGLDELGRLTTGDPAIYYEVAVAWANMGATAQALEALGNAVRLGYPARLIAADPLFDSLRAREDFQRIVH